LPPLERSHPPIREGDDADELPYFPTQPDDEDELTTEEARKFLGNISKATFWRQVRAGYIPPPVYVTPRSPRWTRGKLRRHKARNQRLPREAQELRRRARLHHDQHDPRDDLVPDPNQTARFTSSKTGRTSR
jgi:hypothetical protein